MYRKKPVVIEARQFDGTPQCARDLFEWIGACVGHTQPAGGHLVTLTIHTLEGDHRADPGDWIIRGVSDEHYPCKPAIFAATYEPAE